MPGEKEIKKKTKKSDKKGELTKRQFRERNVKPPKASAKFFLLSELKLYGIRNKIQRLPQLRNALGSFGSFCSDDDNQTAQLASNGSAWV